jgi:hypothetical protein
MADFLTEKRTEIEKRLEELRPLHDEYTRLEQAKAALEGVESPGGTSRSTRGRASGSGNGRRRAANGRRKAANGRRKAANGRRKAANGRRKAANGRRKAANGRRRRRAGGRAGEALDLVRKNPGITVAEMADRLGMRQRNYLYRIMANLQSEGAVDKQGRGFVAR